MLQKKILVVDDDAYVRALVVKILNGSGYLAIPAVDAWQAMDQLGQQNIDLIILDLRMPGPVDGEQLLFALRDQGIACLPDFSIREALREGRLVSVLDAFCERRARFFLLWPSGRQVSPKLRAFIDFVAPRVIATLG